MVVQKANQDAYTPLILACEDDVSFGAVDKAMISDLPSGDAACAWRNFGN